MWHNLENLPVVPSGDACTWQLPAKWQDFLKERNNNQTILLL